MSESLQIETPTLSQQMKDTLKNNISKVKLEIDHLLKTIDSHNGCILGEFEQIHIVLGEIHSTAATYYLKTYLSPYTNNYLVLSIAMQHLSERHHGALIVVQREDPVETLIHSGIMVGATLSHSLLESIFYPGGPLHDGAVLVESDRIISASNILPLSKTYTGGSKLGTRHRAALGLSELSDALVLVVSEETGRSSFAFGGKLYPFTVEQFV